MNKQEALEELGLCVGATAELIKAAYRRRVKETHPDVNGSSGDDAAFLRVKAAFDHLMGNLNDDDTIDLDLIDQNEDADAETSSDRDVEAVDVIRIVERFLALHEIEIGFDWSMRRKSDLPKASNVSEIRPYLMQTPVNEQWVLDEILLDLRRQKLGISKGDIERALRKVIQEAQRSRRTNLLAPLCEANLSFADRLQASKAWARLACDAFEGSAELVVAGLQHFIWQVKRKSLELEVSYHLMPVIFSEMQGSGKTTFVERFLAPLHELVPGHVLLSDLADSRSGDVYRYPVLFIDDMQRVSPDAVSVLKSILTTSRFNRRVSGTSRTVDRRQCATLIGTSNVPVEELIPDETGHRRFLTLHFRNGEEAKGGDPITRQTINSVDFALLWESVDVFGESPIIPHLEALAVSQTAGPEAVLRNWLQDLDLDSDAVCYIKRRCGIRAKDLYELFCEETGVDRTISWFGNMMKRLCNDPTIPFGPKERFPGGFIYPIKVPAAKAS